MIVYPTTAPTSDSTEALVDRLRDDVVPQTLAATGAEAYVGGETAAFQDIAARVLGRFPLFLLVAVGITFVILSMAFRSIFPRGRASSGHHRRDERDRARRDGGRADHDRGLLLVHAPPDRITKEFGLTLGVAILIDAFIVRLTLVPAVMWLLDRPAWYLPAWLDRILPRVTIGPPVSELPASEPSRLAPAAATAGGGD